MVQVSPEFEDFQYLGKFGWNCGTNDTYRHNFGLKINFIRLWLWNKSSIVSIVCHIFKFAANNIFWSWCHVTEWLCNITWLLYNMLFTVSSSKLLSKKFYFGKKVISASVLCSLLVNVTWPNEYQIWQEEISISQSSIAKTFRRF